MEKITLLTLSLILKENQNLMLSFQLDELLKNGFSSSLTCQFLRLFKLSAYHYSDFYFLTVWFFKQLKLLFLCFSE